LNYLNHYNSSSGSDIGFNWWGGPDGRNYRQVAVVTGILDYRGSRDKKVKKEKGRERMSRLSTEMTQSVTAT
jgi:hypothetical protein